MLAQVCEVLRGYELSEGQRQGQPQPAKRGRLRAPGGGEEAEPGRGGGGGGRHQLSLLQLLVPKAQPAKQQPSGPAVGHARRPVGREAAGAGEAARAGDGDGAGWCARCGEALPASPRARQEHSDWHLAGELEAGWRA